MPEQLNTKQKGLIVDFKAKAKNFWKLWNSLDKRSYEVSRLSSETQKEYRQLMSDGEGIRSKIEWITGAIDKAVNTYASVKSWISSTFGLDGISQRQLAGMGLIPLIPIAVVGASVSAIGYWVVDAYKFSAKLDEIKRLEALGIAPEKAANIVDKTLNDKGLFGEVGNLVLPLALGIGVLLLIGKK